MKVHLLNDSKQGLGGGWTFLRNLEKSLVMRGVQIAPSIGEADICFVAGATMVTRQTIDTVQSMGKKLVVRLDNVPRNSRNRNTGTSRLKEFAERADLVVWQCKWAYDYLQDFIHPKRSEVIYNGVDTDIFHPGSSHLDFRGNPVYLYSRYNRDETKNWEVAWYEYQLIQRENKNASLVLVGQFSPEQVQYNYDFFRGEKIIPMGIIGEANDMADIMRGCKYLMATYFNDCYSNTYLEALACGMELVLVNQSGGTPELIKNFENGMVWNGLERMGADYLQAFKSLL